MPKIPEDFLETLKSACKNDDAYRMILQQTEDLFGAVSQRAATETAIPYDLLFHYSSIPIVYVLNHEHIIKANPAFLELLGYNETDLVALPLSMLTHPEDIHALHPLKERLTTGEIPSFSLVTRYKKKNGAYVWVRIHVSAISEQRYEMKTVIVFRDITLDRKVEESLRESEVRYRNVIETQSDYVVLLTPASHIIYSNESFQLHFSLSAYDTERANEHAFATLFHHTHQDSLSTRFSELSPLLPYVIIELSHLTPQDEIRWTQWIIQGYFDETDSLTQAQAIGRDITELKNTQDRLRASEAKLMAIQNSTADSLILISPSFEVLTVNKKARFETQAFFGKALKEGDHFLSVLSPFDEEVKTLFHSSFAHALEGELVRVEYEMDFGKEKHWYEWSYYPVYDQNDVLIGVMFTSVDIQQRKHIELELRRSEALLLETARLAKIGRWHYSVSSGSITWSLETFSIFDRSPELGEPTFEELLRYHPQSRMRLLNAIETLTTTFSPFNIEMELITSIGQEKIVRAIGKPIIADGKVVEIYGYTQDITALRQQEAETKKIKSKINEVLETTTDGFFSLDSQRRFTYMNRSAERFLRVSRESLIGINIWDAYQDAVPLKFFEYYERVINDLVMLHFEEYYEPLACWFDVYAYPDGEGGMHAYFRDVTSVKAYETSLRENQDFLQSIYYGITLPIAIIDVDDEGNLRFSNANHAFLSSFFPQDFTVNFQHAPILFKEITMSIFDAIRENLELSVRDKKAISTELEIHHYPVKFAYLAQLSPLCDRKGTVYRIIISFTDITEQKASERRLIESEALLSETEEIAKIGSWSFNPFTQEITWSRSVFQIFERPMSQGPPVLDEHVTYFNQENLNLLNSSIEAALSQQMGYTIELQIQAQSGIKYIRTVGKVEVNEDGTVTRLYGTIQDITEAVAARQEREVIYQQLLQSQKMESVGVLASGVAHEFNNILLGILGNAELLERSITSTPKELKRIKSIKDNSMRAATIIRQMLGFARKGKSQIEPVFISECLDAVLNMIEPTIDRRIHIERELHPCPPILGDRSQIEQVILNLTVNAKDAIEPLLGQQRNSGRITFHIGQGPIPEKFLVGVTPPPAEPYIHLSLTDNGMGIPRELQEKIFEPFFTTKEVGKGTGLGLAMVYGIIKNHHGFIFMESAVNEGTVFHIYLPMVLSSSSASQTQEKQPSTEPSQKTIRILIADDEPLICDYLRDSLESIGHQVTVAQNGHQALEIVSGMGKAIDLVIIDRNMPEMSGDEAILRIKEIHPTVKIIVMSGYLENNSLTELTKKGVHSVITKPFNLNTIFNGIREAFS